MTMSQVTLAKKPQTARPARARPPAGPELAGPSAPEARPFSSPGILALQHAVGNRVVQRLLAAGPLVQRAHELDVSGARRLATRQGNFYRFRRVRGHRNEAGRPQFQHPATAMTAYSGAGNNGRAEIHPAVNTALDTLMAALLAEGARLDDESLKQAQVRNGFRPPEEAEGRAYLGALRKTIRQNPDIFGELEFPAALESQAISELGFTGSAAHDAFRDAIARQPGWTAGLARQLIQITAGFKAPRGGSTHHSGLVVDIDFPYATSRTNVNWHGVNRENNPGALRSAAGAWLNTFAPAFDFDSYNTNKEVWHMEWRNWAGTAADPNAAAASAAGSMLGGAAAGGAVSGDRAAGPVQRRPGAGPMIQREPDQPGWARPAKGSPNAGAKTIGKVKRLPIEGLTVGNRAADLEPDPDRANSSFTKKETSESAKGRAIVLIPDGLDPAQPVEVLIHLHGHGVGYRLEKGLKQTRDEALDKTEAQLEASQRNMIAVLPQGSRYSGFGKFDTDAYLAKVFEKLIALQQLPAGTQPGPVVLSAHSGGGNTVTQILGEKGQPRLPARLAEVVLFDAIHYSQRAKEAGQDPDYQAHTIRDWILRQLEHDLSELTSGERSKKPDQQLEYLKTSLRFRGYHTTGSYARQYKILREAIADWFKSQAGALGGDKSAVYLALRANYQIVDTGLAPDDHDALMGKSLGFQEALGLLPARSRSGQAPAVKK
ncbi:MAG: hypothetical protein JNK29_17835 [Anaerolineales bacterium]|nr:hypothetical protein [Anaerolineales bacterium]